VARRAKLVETLLRCHECALGLVEPALLEERSAEDELGIANLVDEVDPALEERERVPGVLLGQRELARAEVNLGERGDRLRGIRLASDVQRRADRLLQERDRLRGTAEEEVQRPERRQKFPGVRAIVDLLVESLGPLGV
jgi:hypothetical protein